MAYEIGTATNFADLRVKLVAFLTTNAALVAANQQWSIVWTGSGRAGTFGAEDIVLSGPGLSGTDQALIALRSNPLPAGDRYNYQIAGLVGVNPNAKVYTEHTTVSAMSQLLCGNFEMPYWFIANGRRFIVIIKTSTVYHSAYGGLFLPYAPPNIYPYPLAVGGTCGPLSADPRWSDTGYDIHHFVDPGTSYGLSVFDYQNFWNQFRNWPSASNSYRSNSPYVVGPWHPGAYEYRASSDETSLEPNFYDNYMRLFLNKINLDINGCYPLTPATLIRTTGGRTLLGVLHGVYHVPGLNLSAETVLSQSGVQYLCIPDVYREGNQYYAAYALDGE